MNDLTEKKYPTKIMYSYGDMRFFGLDPNIEEDRAAWRAKWERLLASAGKPTDKECP